jgi:nucleotide-binding universal stress UspA family protein
MLCLERTGEYPHAAAICKGHGDAHASNLAVDRPDKKAQLTPSTARAKRAVACGAKIATQNKAELVLFHFMRHRGSGRVPPDLEELEHIEHVHVTEADMLQSIAESIVNDARDLAVKQGAANV